MIIKLESPVCIAQKRGTGNFIETLDYIPGSTIRGSLAMLYIKHYGISDTSRQKEFDDIFNSDQTRFGNCYIEGGKVIPFTASSCKYHSGFHDPPKCHGVLDTLIATARYESQDNYSMPKKYDKCEYDPRECQSVMDRFGGYYKNKDGYKSVKVSKRLIAHTAIMESTETAVPETLYTQEVLNEKSNDRDSQIFKGIFETCANPDVILNMLRQDNNTIYVGTGKSRGFGKVNLIIKSDDDVASPLSERFNKLNEKINIENKCFFSVTLNSDAILLDEILNYKPRVDTCDFIEALENSNNYLELNDINIFKDTIGKFQHLRDWASTHIITGWNMAHKLPKEDEIAISKGSVFLFSIDESLTDNQKDNLCRMLTLIEQVGIGERRNEGFGKISICDEFHLEETLK